MPKDWKWSLSVHHHSTIVLTIQSAPIDLLAEYNRVAGEHYKQVRMDAERFPFQPETKSTSLNSYHPENSFDGALLTLFKRILAAMNEGNHDRSDAMTDYFDVGWYVTVHIGRWDKPFRYTPKTVSAEMDYETLKAKVEALKAQLGGC